MIRLLTVSNTTTSSVQNDSVSIVGMTSSVPEWADCLEKLRKGDSNKYKAFASLFGIKQENIFMCDHKHVGGSKDRLVIALADAFDSDENPIVATKVHLTDGDHRVNVRRAEFRVPTGKTFANLYTYKATSLLGTNGVVAKVPIVLESGRYHLLLAMYGPWLSNLKVISYFQEMLPEILEPGTGISYAQKGG